MGHHRDRRWSERGCRQHHEVRSGAREAATPRRLGCPPLATPLGRFPAALVVAIALSGTLAAAQLPEGTIAVSSDGGASYTLNFFAQPAGFGADLSPSTSYQAYLAALATPVAGDYNFGCSPLAPVPAPANQPTVIFAARGNCSFTAKALNAQAAGADAVVVYTSLPGIYVAANSSAPSAQLQANACDYDCSTGAGTVPASAVTVAQAYAGYPGQCGSSRTCASQLCALTTATPTSDGSRQICCVTEDYIIMGGTSTATANIQIPAVLLPASTGTALAELIQTKGGGMRRRALQGVQSGAASVLEPDMHDSRGAGVSSIRASSGNGLRRTHAVPRLAAGGAARQLHEALFGVRSGAVDRGARSSSLVDEAAAACLAGASQADASARMGQADGVFFRAQRTLVPTGATATIRELAAGSAVFVQLAWRQVPRVDPGTVLIWLMGCAVVVVASFVSAAEERAKLRFTVTGDIHSGRAPASSTLTPAVPPVSITTRQALLFLAFSAALLLALFMMVRFGVPVVYIVMALFVGGAITSFRFIVLMPALHLVAPKLESTRAVSLPRIGALSVADLIALPISIALVTIWVVYRQAHWSWILQDVFGACLCCLFLLQVRLPTLKTAAVLFVVFFAYDIFMVFLTPYIFGSSVMLDVATAGAPSSVANQACYCRLNPDDSSHCGPGEMMPILLRVPRIVDYRGGYSMLGLGDIVIPGLLLSFALRWDYDAKRRAVRRALMEASAAASSASARAAASSARELVVDAPGGSVTPTTVEGVEQAAAQAAAAAEAGAEVCSPAVGATERSPSSAASSQRAGVQPAGEHGAADAANPGVQLSARAQLALALPSCTGYYTVAVAGYILGLAAANAAVILMATGQPALLYLCPCTLIPVALLAHARGDWGAMWHGPRTVNTAAAEQVMTGDAGTAGVTGGDVAGGGGRPSHAEGGNNGTVPDGGTGSGTAAGQALLIAGGDDHGQGGVSSNGDGNDSDGSEAGEQRPLTSTRARGGGGGGVVAHAGSVEIEMQGLGDSASRRATAGAQRPSSSSGGRLV